MRAKSGNISSPSDLQVYLLKKALFITGAAGRNAYLEVMMKMAEKYKKKMWG